MKNTGELMKHLKSGEDIGTYLSANEDQFITVSVSGYLTEVLKQKGLTRSEVIRRSGMDKVYAYQIFDGKRSPSRDKLLLLAFGMELDPDETQKLLKYCAMPTLYPKSRRDSILIYALERHMSVIDLNLLLDEKNEAILE